jgi:lysophospholipase L1-like esterase
MAHARRRKWLFRIAAVLVGLLPILVLEAALRLAGLPAPDELYDPWITFEQVQPLFEIDEAGEHYVIAQSRRTFFAESGFRARKDPGSFRIFCLGGSTVQGRPYQPPTAFSQWLQLNLQAAEPSRQWEVVNCGGVSYASYRLVPILEEVLGHDPDLVILYTGHNEFLEDRSYGDYRQPSGLTRVSQQVVSRLRTVALARRGWLALRGEPTTRSPPETLPSEVHARLDEEGGLALYQRDDAWRRQVIDHFGLNLRRMIRLAEEANVPLLLVNPVEDLRDSPPFKSTFDDRLSPGQLEQCQQLLASAIDDASLEARQRLELLDQLLAIDPRRADAIYLKARILEAEGNISEAGELFVQAKDEDLCPLRMLEPMHDLLALVARQQEAPLVDVRAEFTRRVAPGVVGRPQLVDHVHPSLEGHQWIADSLVRQMAAMEMVTLEQGWKERRGDLERKHLATLDEVYFAHGRKRLEGLRMWTQGLAGRIDLLIERDRQSGDDAPAEEEKP